MMDLFISSIICGRTNVGVFLVNRAVNELKYDFLPEKTQGNVSHHAISHGAKNTAPFTKFFTAADKWHAGHLARLLQALDSVPEDGGTMLDHTIVMWTTETNHPNTHLHHSMQLGIFGGGAIPGWKTGQVIDGKGTTPYHNAHVSIMRAFGFDQNTFGPKNGSKSTGPLTELYA